MMPKKSSSVPSPSLTFHLEGHGFNPLPSPPQPHPTTSTLSDEATQTCIEDTNRGNKCMLKNEPNATLREKHQ